MPCSATLTARGRSTSEALIADRQHPAWRGSCPHEVYAGTWTDPYTGQRRTVTNLIDPVQTRQIPIDRLAGAVHLSLYQAWRTRVCLLDLSSPGPVHAVDPSRPSNRCATAITPAVAIQVEAGEQAPQ